MLLENMGDRQLNFGRPLLSVRRQSSTVVIEKDNKRNSRSSRPSIPRPPAYKSELKSGPVSNPGKVPFQWERCPGRPKDERTTENCEEPLAVPKLPPGRVSVANQQNNDNVSANSVFNKSQDSSLKCSQNVSPLDELVREIESSQEEQAEEDKSESGDDDEVYEDALDSLSRTESFFCNCSVSGISGLNCLDVKPPDTFSTDPQAKEFMVGRFLPAAKAMISETPQQAPSKKQSVVRVKDIPRQLKVVNGDNRPQLRYGPSLARHYAESQYTSGEESEDEYNENENFHGNACGLLPKFCLKSSMCLLNPLHGMSVRTRRPPFFAARRVQARSSSASTCSKTDNELSSFDTSEQRSIDGCQTTELFEDRCDLANHSNIISPKSQKLDGSSAYGLSHHPKESSASVGQVAPPAISVEIKDIRGDGVSLDNKGYKSFRDLLADERISEELDSGSPAVEKTLYVDSMHDGTSVEQKTSGLTNLGEVVDKVSTKIAESNLSEDPLVVKESNNVSERDVSKTDFLETLSFSPPPLASKTSRTSENNAPKAFGEDERLYQDTGDSKISLMPVENAAIRSLKNNPKPEKLQNFHGINAEFPVPPPLPNSPSDSWLCRTLPAVSLKNSSRLSHFGTGIHLGNQASKPPSGDPKWETIVKATKVHHHHLRYSEELLAPITES